MKTFNVGCGPVVIPGAINCDNVPGPGIDLVFDANGAWPVESCSFDQVVLHHVIEHLARWQHALEEAHRVLKPGGTCWIKVPHGKGIYAHAPGHIHFFSAITVHHMLRADPRVDYPKTCFYKVKARYRMWLHHNLLIDAIITAFPFLWEKINLFPPDEIELLLRKGD